MGKQVQDSQLGSNGGVKTVMLSENGFEEKNSKDR